jgi:hypothetical protein
MKQHSRLTVSTFGTIVGIAGLEHGVGEILQGNTIPSGVVIESWPNIEAYEILGGEPAMTLIPNLLLSGILTVIVSIILMIWAIRFIDAKHGGLTMILLSLLLLPIGGGFAPPLMGSIVGGFGWRMNSRTDWAAGNNFGLIWPLIFIGAIIGYFTLWPGMVILSMIVPAESLPVMPVIVFSFSALILALISSFSYKSERGINQNQL